MASLGFTNVGDLHATIIVGGGLDRAADDGRLFAPVTEDSYATDSSDGTGAPDAAADAAAGTPQPAPPSNPFLGFGIRPDNSATEARSQNDKWRSTGSSI